MQMAKAGGGSGGGGGGGGQTGVEVRIGIGRVEHGVPGSAGRAARPERHMSNRYKKYQGDILKFF